MSRYLRRALIFGALLPRLISAALLPTSTEEVNSYLLDVEGRIEVALREVTEISPEKRSFENTLLPLNRLAQDVLADFGKLSFLSQLEVPYKVDAARAVVFLQNFFGRTVFKNPLFARALIDYAKTMTHSDATTPYERFGLYHLLMNAKQNGILDPELDELIQENRMKPRTPYIFMQGSHRESTYRGSFTLFSLNTCFCPGHLPLISGGVRPWKERLSALAETIRKHDADVICLQEVHGEDASLALYEELKESYPYFYISIGPKPLAFVFETLCMPSGLFVASRYPLDKPTFTSFSEVGLPMNYGFFDFTLLHEGKPIGHIYTTHLQSLDLIGFPEIRASQLVQILDKMGQDLVQEPPIPFILCGDLNSPYGSKEPAQELLMSYFHDAYNAPSRPINAITSTCTEYFTHRLLFPEAGLDPNFQILDYTLLLRKYPGDPRQSVCLEYGMKTVLVPMNDTESPDGAISDHHGLLTEVRQK